MKKLRNIFSRGQSTLELAMLLPVLFFLLYMIIKVFVVHDKGAVVSLEEHQAKLELYDHGNGYMEFDGGLVPEGSYGYLFDGDTYTTPLEELLAQAVSIGANYAIDELLNSIPFLDGTTLVSGYARGYVGTGLRNYVNTGSWDHDAAMWGGVVGSASSNQASEILRGFDPSSTTGGESRGWHELLGTGIQAGAQAYGSSEGDWSAAGAGAMGGLFASNTAEGFLTDQSHEVISAAARGALTSAAGGIITGDFDLGEVGKSAAINAFQTRTVAEFIPGSGGMTDPRNSASFGAANAIVSSVITNGSNVKIGDLAVAGADGAFFSQQSTSAISGEGNWAAQWSRSTLATASYGAGKAWATGADSQAIGTAALNSAVYSTATVVAGHTTNWFGEKIKDGTQWTVNGIKQGLGIGTSNDVAQMAEENIRQSAWSFEQTGQYLGSEGQRIRAGEAQ